MSLTPYESMNNNPISLSDPDGDIAWFAPVAGAAIGTLSNGFQNITSGNGFFDSAFGAAFVGAWGGAMSNGIGDIFGETGGIGNEMRRAIAHGVSGGFQSMAGGGSFGSGFLSGGLSSGIGSGIGALGGGSTAQWAGGGLSGGIGSVIGGGNLFQGAGMGLMVGGLNHAANHFFQGDPTSISESSGPGLSIDRFYNQSPAADVLLSQANGGGALLGYAGSMGSLAKSQGLAIRINSGRIYMSSLYRSNGTLMGNASFSGRTYISGLRFLNQAGTALTIASAGYDMVYGYQNNHTGYMWRGLFSGAANFIPYAGPVISYGISRIPARYLKTTFKEYKPNWNHTCFVKGTIVTLSDGSSRNIEDIKKGDLILSVNTEEMIIEEDLVLELPIKVKKYRKIKMILEDDRIVEFSPAHPFWVVNKGWSVYDMQEAKKELNIKVSQLTQEDILLVLIDGSLKNVNIKKLMDTDEYVEMYNVEHVKKNHSFFANGILVHNKR